MASYTNTIPTHYKYDFHISPYCPRDEVELKLKEATGLNRSAKMLDTLLSAGIGIGVISTLAAAIFLGAPYFVAIGLVTAGFTYAGIQKRYNNIEDIETIKNYYKDFKAFDYPTVGYKERISEVYNDQLGYSTYSLKKI